MIRRFFSREHAKLKEMTFAEKRWYIWEYYKIHIILIGFTLFVAGSLINIWFINPPRRDYLYISWQGDPVFAEVLDDMATRLGVIVPDYDRYRVSVNSYVMTGDPQMDQVLVSRFHAMLSVGDVHATITTGPGIQEAAEVGLIRPPVDVLAIIQESDPQLYYYIVAERLLTVTFSNVFDEDAPEVTDTMAIDISGAPLLVDIGIGSAEGVYLGVVVNSQQIEGIARALAVIFGMYEGVDV